VSAVSCKTNLYPALIRDVKLSDWHFKQKDSKYVTESTGRNNIPNTNDKKVKGKVVPVP